MTKPIIFLAYANDQQNKANYLRGLSQEQRGIRMALQGIEKAGLIEIVERVNVALSDIIDVFYRFSLPKSDCYFSLCRSC